MKRDVAFKRGLVIYGSYPDVLSDPNQLLRRLSQVSIDQTFDLVELPLVDDPVWWPKIGKMVYDAGLDVVASVGPSTVKSRWNLSSTDGEIRKVAVEGLRRAVDYSYAIGARTLVFMSGSDPDPAGRQDAQRALLDSIRTVFEYARTQATHYLLSLFLEPADRGVTHKQLIGPSTEAAVLVAAARDNGLPIGVTLDMSHVAQLGETMEEATARLGGLVSHAHLANAVMRNPSSPVYGDQHPRFGAPGSEYGAPEASRFVEMLFARCFSLTDLYPYGKPVISLEVKPAPGDDPDLVLAGAKRVLAKASGPRQ